MYPPELQTSLLFARLLEDNELTNAIVILRSNSAVLADTISRTVPTFTDHSVRHMDALWAVTERVLSPDEIASITPAEAFLLAAGFYLHDIGMANAATPEGLARIRSSPEYRSFLQALPSEARLAEGAEARAVAFAVRRMHAHAANELATAMVSGTNVNLLEPLKMRDAWGATCGRIAASHHWSLEQVEQEFGSLQSAALPGHRRGDLGYVAAILRVVDYAHINRDRAPTLDRIFRSNIEQESLVHWLAQENIDGPERDGGYLAYRAAVPLKDVDAWWLYYDMLKGLDTEIRSVKRYLERRVSSHGRFSLEGVRGVESPEEAAMYIQPSGFMPLEVNVRTGSIERLVALLAGESLYGKDPMAAVRELIQNARDAIALKRATAYTPYEKAALALPIRVVMRSGDKASLEVTDWGIGMTKKVMTDYLITLASDYWTSQFFHDFPDVSGFEPAGKFGIGFLSVFMLGKQITVESNREGGDRYQLELSGVGRRGLIRSAASIPGSGTAIRVQLSEKVPEALQPLAEKVRIYAPMVRHPIEVVVDDQPTTIMSDWVFTLSANELRDWTLNAVKVLAQGRDSFQFSHVAYLDPRRFLSLGRPRIQSTPWKIKCPEYVDTRVRLIGCFEGVSILCLKGLALQPISTPGFVGLIDVDVAITDASRKRALDVNISEIISRAKKQIKAAVIENLDATAHDAFIVTQLPLLAQCVSMYGRDTLVQSSVPWISVIQRPGDVRQTPSADFLKMVQNTKSVFLAYNTGPWTAMKKWEADRLDVDREEVAVVLDGDHEGIRNPSYLSGDEVKTGSLNDLWPNCENGALFGTLLGITADAWQMTAASLVSQEGWHQKGSFIWGRLIRP